MPPMHQSLLRTSFGKSLRGWGLAIFFSFVTLLAHAEKPSFDELFQQLGAPVLLIEPESGRIVDANPAAAAFYGYTQSQLQALTIQSINTLNSEQVARERQLATRQGRNFFIFRHKLADNSVRTVQVNSKPIQLNHRTLLVSVITDVTPGTYDEAALWHHQKQLEEMVDIQTQRLQKSRTQQAWLLGAGLCFQAVLITHLWLSRRQGQKLQRQLLATRNHLQATLNAVPDLLFEIDTDERFISVHTAQQDNLFLPTEEFIGRHLADVMPPHIVDLARQAMQEATLEGTSLGHEYALQVPNGLRNFELSVAIKAASSEEKSGFVLIARDVTQRKADQKRLQLAASVFTHAREGIIITDVQGNIVDVNETFTRITGYSSQEVLGRNPRFLRSDRQGPDFYKAMWQSLTSKGHWYGELWNHTKDGSLYAEMLTIGTVYDDDGQALNYVGLFSDITLQKEHQQELEHIAHYDPLTNLPNRVLLSDRLRQAMAQCQRSDSLLAVVFLDLDGFKSINDRYGHDVGDLLLISLAQRLKNALREGDTLARIGGDEFIAVLAGLENSNNYVPVLERMLQAAAEPVPFGKIMLQVSASLGVTIFPQDAADAEQLMRHADQAMYQAKQAGKNCYHIFDIKNDITINTHTEQLSRIIRALHNNEFVLYYQPKVNIRTKEIIGSEALIRWQHPEKGLLEPSHFLPILEGKSAAAELDEWVIDKVFEQLAEWKTHGFSTPVSINISAVSLQNHGFVQRLYDRQIKYPQLSSNIIELEILETSTLEDITTAASIITACKNIGIKFALDDFGTGYSSLTYLRRLPADQLKIDQSFIRDMLDDPDDLAIVKGIMGLAEAFKRTVIAEGVESTAHGELLLDMGCELAQGYGIAHPMPPEMLPDWSAQWIRL